MTDLEWIKINQEMLHDYETGEISETRYFLNNLMRVK
jgi:hypothetical protein